MLKKLLVPTLLLTMAVLGAPGCHDPKGNGTANPPTGSAGTTGAAGSDGAAGTGGGGSGDAAATEGGDAAATEGGGDTSASEAHPEGGTEAGPTEGGTEGGTEAGPTEGGLDVSLDGLTSDLPLGN